MCATPFDFGAREWGAKPKETPGSRLPRQQQHHRTQAHTGHRLPHRTEPCPSTQRTARESRRSAKPLRPPRRVDVRFIEGSRGALAFRRPERDKTAIGIAVTF